MGLETYSAAVDSWSIGCIFAEMVTGRPMFTGDCEIDQLFKIFKLLGTPTEATWPGVSSLPDYQPVFPKWPGKDLRTVFSRLDANGLDLLSRLLAYSPAQRITTAEALIHPYFTQHLPGMNVGVITQSDEFLRSVVAAAVATGAATPPPKSKKRPASAAAHVPAESGSTSGTHGGSITSAVDARTHATRAGHSKAPRRGDAGAHHGADGATDTDIDLTG